MPLKSRFCCFCHFWLLLSFLLCRHYWRWAKNEKKSVFKLILVSKHKAFFKTIFYRIFFVVSRLNCLLEKCELADKVKNEAIHFWNWSFWVKFIKSLVTNFPIFNALCSLYFRQDLIMPLNCYVSILHIYKRQPLL